MDYFILKCVILRLCSTKVEKTLMGYKYTVNSKQILFKIIFKRCLNEG